MAPTGWFVTGLSTALTIGFLAMALGSMVWGNAGLMPVAGEAAADVA